MAEHLEHKLTKLQAKLDDLHHKLPFDNIPLSMLLEIESLEREIQFLSSNTYLGDLGNKSIN
ncbi:MAG TPA: hypothetical protein ENH19_03765 [Actinobacteria bacterium]|nr:hypothetical protein [Actinomycetes bacterium]HEX21749.1 hypothetical protein [Actinomycetota bacterium]